MEQPKKLQCDIIAQWSLFDQKVAAQVWQNLYVNKIPIGNKEIKKRNTRM